VPKTKTLKTKTKTRPKKAKISAKVSSKPIFERTPIIAVMGHVDHGKTSILDAIRGTKVQEGEEGGITQNTRAHVVIDKKGNKFTFIDTPGHEAFSNMRERGAKVTDIVLLVVAADDGVQPQTIESIKFAQKAKVPIVVAINKIDITGVNSKKIKQELSQHNVLVEEFGGDVLVVEVSAKKKTGLDELLETLSLQAEILELKKAKIDNGQANGFVLESNLDKSLGPVALVILKAGSAEKDDYIVSSSGIDKIRRLLDEGQKEIERAREGDPVWIIGLDDVLNTGEQIIIFDKEKEAKQFLKDLASLSLEKEIRIREEAEVIEAGEAVEGAEGEKGEESKETEDEANKVLLAALLDKEQEEGEVKKLNVILKTDTQGTLEAVTEKLKELSDREVEVNILESSTGDITANEVELAKTTRAIILGFQVGISDNVEKLARREKVLYRRYKLIYELIDEVTSALDSLVAPEEEEVEISRAKVKQVFVLTNGMKVAGSEVMKGNVLKGYSVYVERPSTSKGSGKNKTEAEEIGRGKITSLKKGKEEVREAGKGQECGILIEPQIDLEEGDEVVCYKIERL